MDFVLFSEALNGIHFVLRYPVIDVAGNADIERACPAGQDIDPESVIVAFAHGRRVSQRHG